MIRLVKHIVSYLLVSLFFIYLLVQFVVDLNLARFRSIPIREVYQTNLRRKNADKSDLLLEDSDLCTSKNIVSSGKWLLDPDQERFKWAERDLTYYGYPGCVMQNRSKLYLWHPDHCKMRRINRKTWEKYWCSEIVEKRNITKILFVGDSLMDQQALGLFMQLKDDLSCDGKLHMKQTNNDLLINPPGKQCYNPVTKKGQKFDDDGELLEECFLEDFQEYDIVIINRGAHYRNDTVVFSDMERLVNEFLQISKPTAKLVWRTSAPGHPQCWDVKKPLDHYDGSNVMLYNWREIELQTYKIWDLLSKELGERAILSDINPPTRLRADMHVEAIDAKNPHVDCLHYCQPGPQDTWNEITFNMILKYYPKLSE